MITRALFALLKTIETSCIGIISPKPLNFEVDRFMNGENLSILRIVEAQMFLFMRVYRSSVESSLVCMF